jgi:hypothetical protein
MSCCLRVLQCVLPHGDNVRGHDGQRERSNCHEYYGHGSKETGLVTCMYFSVLMVFFKVF